MLLDAPFHGHESFERCKSEWLLGGGLQKPLESKQTWF